MRSNRSRLQAGLRALLKSLPTARAYPNSHQHQSAYPLSSPLWDAEAHKHRLPNISADIYGFLATLHLLRHIDILLRTVQPSLRYFGFPLMGLSGNLRIAIRQVSRNNVIA